MLRLEKGQDGLDSSNLGISPQPGGQHISWAWTGCYQVHQPCPPLTSTSPAWLHSVLTWKLKDLLPIMAFLTIPPSTPPPPAVCVSF